VKCLCCEQPAPGHCCARCADLSNPNCYTCLWAQSQGARRIYNDSEWAIEANRLGLGDIPLPEEDGYLSRCEATLHAWDQREPVSHGCDSGADICSRITDHRDAPEPSQEAFPNILAGITLIAILAVLAGELWGRVLR
jgi:hypothetical protein